jgi:putative tricarboxylic transport membrane protein
MDLVYGIANSLQPHLIFYCFMGAVLGTLVGVLPGLSPSSAIAILLPATAVLDVTGSIVMLAGIFYGAMYGGSTTSILLNIPGEPASVVSCIEGFPMTRQGKAGQALWICAIGSFIAGTLGVTGLALIGPQIAKYALKFGPPEYFGLLLFSLTLVMAFSGTTIVKGFIAGAVGLFLAAVGLDPLTGVPRLNLESIGLMRGIELIPLCIGLFGIGEMLYSVGEGRAYIYKGKLEGPLWQALWKLAPRGYDLKVGLTASLRGSILGFVLGLIPGMISSLTPFFSYALEKRVSNRPEKFGTGAIEGLAGPEATNNATAQAGFIPMLALGIPSGAAIAVIMAAFMMHGLQPGPALFITQKEFAWTVIGSMYLGNVMLLILNLPLVGIWARISLLPYKILCPLVLVICLIGAYSPRNTLFDVWVALFFGLVGYTMRKKQWPLAPMILGFVLGDLFEGALRQSLSMAGGSPKIFFERPIPVIFIVLTVVTGIIMWKVFRKIPRSGEAEV